MTKEDYKALRAILVPLIKKKQLENFITVDELISETQILIGGDSAFDLKNFAMNAGKFLTIERRKLWNSKDHLPEEKKCYKCKKLFYKSSFSVVSEKKCSGDRLSAYCKSCASGVTKEWYYKKKQTKEGREYLKSINKKMKESLVKRLPDHYIIQILTQTKKYTKEFLKRPENYYLIEDRRKQILKRRRLLNKLKNCGRAG